jgi:hypothetical protein
MSVSWGDEEEVRTRTPVDPWPAVPVDPMPATGRRRVYGFAYEIFTSRPDIDGEHPYAGQTTTTIHQRVHGPNGHTSPAEVAKSPWKARIKPGRAGYRCLKVIYATGDPGADQVRLDMAETFAIDQLHTTYNIVRPIRPPADVRQPRKPATVHTVPKPHGRMVGFLLVWAALSLLAGRVAAAGHLPIWWAAGAVVIAWPVFLRLHRVTTWLSGKPVPRQPTIARRAPARRRRR